MCNKNRSYTHQVSYVHIQGNYRPLTVNFEHSKDQPCCCTLSPPLFYDLHACSFSLGFIVGSSMVINPLVLVELCFCLNTINPEFYSYYKIITQHIQNPQGTLHICRLKAFYDLKMHVPPLMASCR